jgi:catechol 2,3-dioxygenase-like lactoylglutathione lyase family enzyme
LADAVARGGEFGKTPGVRATRINHVSISARDLEESARFYEEVFGLERLPTPTFDNPVIWFRLGDGQLHLFERSEADPPQFHHLGMEVDDFEAFYIRLTELGIRDSDSLGHIRELPSGEVQMYLRDPGGNLVEIDWPDARTLDRSIVTDLRRLADDQPQAPGAENASLFTARG